ncbi:MAG: FHIPEP family type III secretion protein, partial [Bryobacteraceae bacterium]
MPARAANAKIINVSEMAVPIGVLAIIIAMITPLPAVLLDLLIVTDIMFSVVVMMVALYIARPVDFTVFPTTLLLLTLFRLALNISSSRLILLNGNSGTAAAGHVIEAFGSFVVGGNYIIGVVIFLVLIAIQYVVINHGAVRISEVTARFTLDALPGKQMAIDADLNAGLIDETQARDRRKGLASEAEFYGAMDVASRFTQRDAVASILITVINILAGFLIGVLQHGMDLRRAIETYTILTIGDGLVTVIPALMISVSGALVVTRASSDERLGADFQKQLFNSPQPLFLSSGVLVALAAFPGLPAIPFLALGGGLGAIAWRMRQKEIAGVTSSTEPAATPPTKENLDSLLRVDPLSIEVGLGLAGMISGGATSPLLQKIAAIRKQFASTSGYVIPPVRVTDNMALRSREYIVSIKGGECSRYELAANCDLAIPTPKAKGIEGQTTKEPAFGLQAVWVARESDEVARSAGYTVVDALNVMG